MSPEFQLMRKRVHKKTVIPLSPFPVNMLKGIIPFFIGFGAGLAKAMPNLKTELEQAEIELDAEEYSAIMLFLALFYFAAFTILGVLFGLKLFPDTMWTTAPIIGFFAALMVLIQIIAYPHVLIKKKIRDLEQNLIFGLRTITVQIRSGVSLFDGLSLIADGNYGQLSTEFQKIVDEINTGIRDEDALQRSALRNPSLFYRRAIWQIVNGMKAGADITAVLSELVHSMTKEQVIQIKKYGASLKMLSLVYMMLGVIIPALGLTFIIVLSTFPQIPISQMLLWGFLGFLILAQFMFVGLLKSRRPSLLASD
ncbi:MAG: type II secretion system F family protein [Candidatus Micrarchaeota archaeon]